MGGRGDEYSGCVRQVSDGKILIMGTGGCGSGFIWHMLRHCSLETTVHREWIRSGGIMQSDDPRNFPAPKVIKHNGGFLHNMNTHVENFGWEVEHVFYAVATLDLAMGIQKERLERRGTTFDYDTELERYYAKLGRGLDQLAESDYPFTIVRCPASILDVEYCWNKLKVVLPSITFEQFTEKHSEWVFEDRVSGLTTYDKSPS